MGPNPSVRDPDKKKEKKKEKEKRDRLGPRSRILCRARISSRILARIEAEIVANCCRGIYFTYTYAWANTRVRKGLASSSSPLFLPLIFFSPSPWRNRLYDITLPEEARDIRFMHPLHFPSLCIVTLSPSMPFPGLFFFPPFFSFSFFSFLFFSSFLFSFFFYMKTASSPR